jgi:hypothetical protein
VNFLDVSKRVEKRPQESEYDLSRWGLEKESLTRGTQLAGEPGHRPIYLKPGTSMAICEEQVREEDEIKRQRKSRKDGAERTDSKNREKRRTPEEEKSRSRSIQTRGVPSDHQEPREDIILATSASTSAHKRPCPDDGVSSEDRQIQAKLTEANRRIQDLESQVESLESRLNSLNPDRMKEEIRQEIQKEFHQREEIGRIGQKGGEELDGHWLSQDENLALTWDLEVKYELTNCRGRRIVLSHQGLPFRIVEKEFPRPEGSVKLEVIKGTHGWVGTGQMATSLQAISEEMDMGFRTVFRHAVTSMCHTVLRVYDVLQMLSYANPTVAECLWLENLCQMFNVKEIEFLPMKGICLKIPRVGVG